MAAKKKPPRAKKAKAPGRKAPPARKVAVTGQSLRLAAKQADVQVRRAGEAYDRADAEQALGVFYANEAKHAGRPFFNFRTGSSGSTSSTRTMTPSHSSRSRSTTSSALVYR
jgi:hypothetical protein